MNGSRERADFASLDRYLVTVFALMEGMASVDQAIHQLQHYLQWHRRARLDPGMETFLIELFFDKCRKEFTAGPD